ncbi:MAG: adenylate/guanylate cyclase domain-containing protein, partial [Merismopedia sp. SIO2A8]|nr:adenylate/guanylate cyclase domain-containing protein [Merismopedia sp. SIO2A8]
IADSKNGVELRPTPEIEAQAAGAFILGHVVHIPDPDGISRQALLCRKDLPALSVAAIKAYQSSLDNTSIAVVETEDSANPLANSTPPANPTPLINKSESESLLPLLPQCQSSDSLSSQPSPPPVWINWPGPIFDPERATTKTTLQIVSFVDVVTGRVDADVLRNKIVLVGVTARGLDPARSPLNYDPPITGVYVHAAVIDNLLNDRFLHRPPTWSLPFLLVLLGLSTSLLLSNQGSKGRIMIVFGIPFSWFSIGLLCFLGNWWIPVAAPVATVLMTIIGFQWQEQREKQQLMNLFSMHVAPQTAQLIWSRRDELLANGQLQPQELTATVLFMDIRGFTSISEKMPSHQLVPWLNRYFEVMTDCIMEHGGVVDKYIGDAIMAVFGIPFPRTDQADIQQDAIAAIATSIDMYQRLQHLNIELAQQKLPTISIGIGIHTGVLTAGSVGSQQRVNYSVFGDTVNTAARLESMTKTLPPDAPYNILMSEQTFTYVKTTHKGRATGRLKLKGKEAETMTYTLTS